MKVLDSSFCADFLRGRDHAKQYRLAHRNESFALSEIGFYELYHGAVKVGRDPVAVDRDLPWVDRLDYTPAHSRESARIRAELAEQGQRIQHPDMMIAGVARSLDAPLVTSDTDVDCIDDLTVENPHKMY
ncbi:type II toxin-antitoxin system VapC family toxin [Natronolimnohabitans innermongolicus]|uniref:Twitching mobility protein PilT n=1 Tax=Natronolimnohabitans innermongolicus JCM 12255 TaxID=1227499 RepID=L9XJD9_9EURY|nr:type II toxin-antitoxin system VapC family toxin [Natronolimnohabitans innermongolicus]ELY61879.1 twitching mobility protein PilT [Natronolimnohabitans innermongolicus JCM 12255]